MESKLNTRVDEKYDFLHNLFKPSPLSVQPKGKNMRFRMLNILILMNCSSCRQSPTDPHSIFHQNWVGPGPGPWAGKLISRCWAEHWRVECRFCRRDCEHWVSSIQCSHLHVRHSVRVDTPSITWPQILMVN